MIAQRAPPTREANLVAELAAAEHRAGHPIGGHPTPAHQVGIPPGPGPVAHRWAGKGHHFYPAQDLSHQERYACAQAVAGNCSDTTTAQDRLLDLRPRGPGQG